MLPYVLAWLSSFNTEEEGQGMVEYALILVLVSIVAIATLRLLGSSVMDVFSEVTGEMTS